jgi:hypothetical protein
MVLSNIGMGTNIVSFKKLISHHIKPKNLIIDSPEPNINKILFICTVDSFDLFTKKYGYLDSSKNLRIKWKDTANDFKGIGLSNDVRDKRFLTAVFSEQNYPSWWVTEYHNNEFIEFVDANKSEQIEKKYLR